MAKEPTFQEKLAALKAKSEAAEREIRETYAAKREKSAALHEAQRRAKDANELVQGTRELDEKPRIPGLAQRIAETRTLITRSRELEESQERLLDEMTANPLQEGCDAVYAEMGNRLKALDDEEYRAAEEAGAYLEADEQQDEHEDELERSGQPPPLRRA